MKDYRETHVPQISMSLLHNDHKIVREKRFVKSASSKMSSLSTGKEMSSMPDLGISLMQRERKVYRHREYPMIFGHK